MFDRLDDFAKTLPQPKLGGSWEACYRQHVRNAERMRAEAFKYAVQDVGRGLWAAGRTLTAPLAGIRRRLQAAIAPADRPADAWRGGAD